MDAHHSFKEFSQATEPHKLPFNASPDRTEGAGEATSFLKLPFKRNARLLKNKSQPFPIALFKTDEEYTYLDFEQCLKPWILGSVVRDCDTTRRMLEKEDALNGVKVNAALKATEGMSLELGGYCPSPSQWYLLNQLRVHAGAPERSNEGIDKLIQYFTSNVVIIPSLNIWSRNSSLKLARWICNFSGLKLLIWNDKV
jgi:hypothetical protein